MNKIVDVLNKKELLYNEDERPLYHINCAEVLLLSANEKYKLMIDDRFIKGVCPFGGGLQSESTCGALLGALAALGIMFTEDRPCTNEKMKSLTRKYVQEFEKEFGSIDCKHIKEYHRSETEGCSPVKIRAAEMFERVINEIV